MPLADASGAGVGDLIVLHDVSALKSAQNRLMVVKALAKGRAMVKDVALLGYHGPLPWTQTAAGLEVKLPAQKPGDHAFTLKIAAE